MSADHIFIFLLTLAFSVAAAVVGCIALMRRMLLASDVVSHLTLPGLGVALLLGISPLGGAAATLFLGTLLVWQLRKKTELTTESAIAVVFVGALALGAAITPNEHLAESLFGELPKVSIRELFVGLGAVACVLAAIHSVRDQLTLEIFSPELASATGVNVKRLDLSFLLLFSLTVLIGLRFMGALLASALIIIPAAAARRLTSALPQFLMLACCVSLLSVIAGFLLNDLVFHLSTGGPLIAVCSTLLFAATLLKRGSE